ncbi:universal stress protein [Flavobacterium terrigena]|uniref:Nucleotide-binding universal stress protein, UspA family n=1 Tax=Flavobacterium terrigena TaxID=402734 RepID=A0A1H6Q8X7_9FLAO|nr:universal stress protein [Flavobacterium terrigena]SEI40239.1 Nucleotide-binding universal stress protein, UspA family [Flavobacterium terrigena]
MKKIIFPVDFSKASLNAFPYALHLAKKMGAEIITIHVYNDINLPYPDYHDYIMEKYQIAELEQFENFRDEVPKLRTIAEKEQLGRVIVRHVLKEGDTQDSILKVALDEKADFIVMGTKGASGLKEVFLGTLTQKIMNNSKIPVIAIPENCKYLPLKKILFITEYNLSQLPILKKIHNLALLFNAHIDVLQVTNFDNRQDEIFSDEWKKIRPISEVNFYLLNSIDIEGTIFDFIEHHKINWITLSTHHYNFFEKLYHLSLSKNLAYHSDIPILSIYEK